MIYDTWYTSQEKVGCEVKNWREKNYETAKILEFIKKFFNGGSTKYIHRIMMLSAVKVFDKNLQ